MVNRSLLVICDYRNRPLSGRGDEPSVDGAPAAARLFPRRQVAPNHFLEGFHFRKEPLSHSRVDFGRERWERRAALEAVGPEVSTRWTSLLLWLVR